MSEHVYEVEVKSLLGDKHKAEELLNKMLQQYPELQLKDSNSQLNHYFIGGSLAELAKNLDNHIKAEDVQKIESIAGHVSDFSVRTRDKDGKVYIVVKASVDDTNSSNGTARIEIESQTKDLDLNQLDSILLSSGFEYQAKWSRQRKEYKFKNMNVCIDKNAGYGYLAEFERMVADITEVDKIKNEIRQVIESLGFEELDQGRLDRMFEHYNQNWSDYYGTDKVFNIL